MYYWRSQLLKIVYILPNMLMANWDYKNEKYDQDIAQPLHKVANAIYLAKQYW